MAAGQFQALVLVVRRASPVDQMRSGAGRTPQRVKCDRGDPCVYRELRPCWLRERRAHPARI